MATRKVTRGEPLDIPADAYNAFIDAAESHKAGILTPEPGEELTGVLPTYLVKNGSGQDAPRFGVLQISSIVTDPDENLDEFKNRPVLTGSVPSQDSKGRIMVLSEPIADGKIGRAWLSGVFPCRIDVKDEGHTTAGEVVGVIDHFESGKSTIQILWKQTGTGVKWAVGRLSPSTPGGASVRWAIVLGADSFSRVLNVQEVALVSGTGGLPVYRAVGQPFEVFCYPNSSGRDFQEHVVTEYSTEAQIVALFTDANGIEYADQTMRWYVEQETGGIQRGTCRRFF